MRHQDRSTTEPGILSDFPESDIRQWLPAHLAGPGNHGWLGALDGLDATLPHIRAAATDAGM